jgi:glycosyltransferase involved in cell wall biosynthesis
MAPFFSIVIPTFNRADRIILAVNSVLQQTFEDFEAIIVDDGSTDETEKIVKEISDHRIRYFKKENEERSIARNFGISNAKGKYINFLDSDDQFYVHHLETAYQLLNKNHFPEICHLGYETINEKGEILERHANLDEHIEKRILDENVLSCNSIFIQRNIVLEHSFLHSRQAVISEDWYLWLKLIARYKVYYDNTVTSAVVEHEQRSLRNINPDKLIASTEVIIKSLKEDKVFKSKYGKGVNYFFSNQYTMVALILALSKQRRLDTLKYLLKSVQQDWRVIFRRRFLASIKHLP